MTRRAIIAVVSLVAGSFWLVAAPAEAADQSVFAYGDAAFHGSTGNVQLNHPIVGMARTPSGSGYWLAARDGRVFSFGAADHHGSAVPPPPSPVVGIAATPTGRGYWLATENGSIYAFGDAPFLGSLGNVRLAKPIVGIAATRSGGGYWMVAEDGGIFSFGDAGFFGSTGAMRLNQPITGMAATPSSAGYWLVARDGGIFTFGDATFVGSTGALKLVRPIAAMAATPSGKGYWLVAGDGGLFTFGDAPFFGSLGGGGLSEPAVGVVGSNTGQGYWIVSTGHLNQSPTANPDEVRILPGTYQVSTAGPVKPGTYRAEHATKDCHWERLGAQSGSESAVLATNTSDDRQVVTIRDTDKTFRTSGCAPFTTNLFPITSSLYAPFGDGTWIVGTDVGAGKWSAPGGAECEWARVSDFSGELSSLKATDNPVETPVVVQIEPGDAGFVSSDCGAWSRA